MQSSQIKKLHHYLPRFYLKLFSNREDDQIYQYKIKDKSYGLVHPNVIAAENYLYALQEDGYPVDTSIEDFFSGIDGNTSRIFKKIITNPGCRLNVDDQSMLISFLAFMHLRVPDRINSYGQIAKDQTYADLLKLIENKTKFEEITNELRLSAIEKEQVKNDILNLKSKFKIDVNRNFILSALFDQFPLIYSLLSAYKWYFLLSGNSNNFVTCDNPVVLFERHTGLILAGGGFQRPNIEITFPISNNLCLMGRISQKPKNNKIIKVNKKVVDFINHRTIISAYRFVYSSKTTEEIAFNLDLKKEIVPFWQNAGVYTSAEENYKKPV